MLKSFSKSEKALFALGCLLVLSRFVGLHIVPFLIDEPLFQVWAQEMIQNGKIRLVAMGGSSLPVSYGGGAIWLYAIPNAITANPMGFVLFHTILYCSGFFSLFFATRKFFGNKIALYSFLLAASSPFLFFFSRHAWDTTFYMPIMMSCVLLLTSLADPARENKLWAKNGTWKIFSGLALLLALAINIQLSCGPFVLMIGLASLFLWATGKQRSKDFFLGIVFMVALVIALITPYILEAWHVQLIHPPLVNKKINEHWGTARHLWWNILYSLTWLSTWHANIFFEPVNADFNALAGTTLSKIFKLDIFGWITKLFAIFGLILPLLSVFTRNKAPFLAWVATIGFGIAMLVFQFLNIPMQPHYFQSFWWLPFAGFAGFLFYAQAAEKIWVKCVVAGALATNIAFLCVAMVFLLQNTGTRGLHHGTGIVEVSRAVSEMCAQGKSMGKNNFSLDVAPVFTPDNAIKYFFDRNEPCRGMNLTITRLAWPNVDARLTYDASTATSARLLTEWKP